MGSNHVDTLKAQHNMAVVLASRGKYEEALNIFKKVYEKRKIVLGVNNPYTLRTLFNIATTFNNQRKISKALIYYEEILNNQEKVLRPKHPDILKTRYLVANIHFAQGKLISAYKAYKEDIDQMKIVFGPYHQDVPNDVLKRIKLLNVMFKADGIEASKVLYNLQNNINIAARNGDIQIVQKLLEDGADPNQNDVDGRTPLHFAVSNGHLSVMNILLQNGADVARATDKINTTLLHTATAKDCKEIVDVLLRHVSPEKLNEFINAKTTVNGDTSLHIAVSNGALHIIKSLLKGGANYNIKNNKDKTPLDLSHDQYKYNLLKLVEELFEDARNGNVRITGKLRSYHLMTLKL